MGVDSNDYPFCKVKLNPKGKRRFLYIGNTQPWKNTMQLTEIAKKIPKFEGGYISNGSIPEWKKIADHCSLDHENLTKLADEYDFFLSVSTFDAQATTVLEQMSIGMVVGSTPQSGYDYHTIIKLDPHNTDFNCVQIDRMQQMNEEEYFSISKANLDLLKKNHFWESIAEKVLKMVGI